MKNRCLVVLGLHRGGTSIVAALLHKLGVDMGSVFQPPDDRNRVGYYEDIEFLKLHDKIIGDDWSNPQIRFMEHRDEYGDLLKRYSHKTLWGVKDPKLCLFFHSFLESAKEHMPKTEIKVVDVRRDMSLVAKSICNPKFPSDLTFEQAFAVSEMYDYCKTQGLRSFQGDRLVLDHQSLVDSPEETVKRLAKFAGVEYKQEVIEVING